MRADWRTLWGEAARLLDAGEHRRAAEHYVRARRARSVEIAGKVEGDEAYLHLRVDEGRARIRTTEYDAAIDILAPVVQAAEEHLGLAHGVTARAHLAFGTALFNKGRMHEATAHFERCHEAMGRGADVDDATKAIALNSLAAVAYLSGDVDGAIGWLEASVAHFESCYGPGHADATRPMENLAWIHAEASRMGEADRWRERLWAAAERAYPIDHPRMGSIHATIAAVHYANGRFVRAVDAYERAFELLPAHDRRRLPDRQNLAALHASLGNLHEAGHHARLALRHAEEYLDPRHPQRFGAWRAVAHVDAVAGRPQDSVARMERALNLEEEAEADADARFVNREALADFAAAAGDYRRAIDMAREALRWLEGAARDLPRNRIRTLTILGRAQRASRRPTPREAARCAVRTLREAEKHARRADALDQPMGRAVREALAEAQAARGDMAGARRTSERLVSSALATRRDAFALLDGERRRQNAQRYLPAFQRLLMAPRTVPRETMARWIGLWFTHRQSATFAAAALLRYRAQADASARERVDAYRAALCQEAVAAMLGGGTEHHQRLAALETRLGRGAIEAFDEAVSPIAICDVARHLRAGEAFLDIAWLPEAVVGITVTANGQWTRARLGRPDDLERHVDAFRDVLQPAHGTGTGEGARRSTPPAVHELAQAILTPIFTHSSTPQTLYVAADGALARVPWAALPWQGQALGDVVTVTRVASPRAFLHARRAPAKQENEGTAPIVLADPNFGVANDGPSPEQGWRGLEGTYDATATPSYRAWLASLRMPRLPHTREEAGIVRDALPHAQVFTGRRATVGTLLSADRPEVLHVATHAFVYSGGEESGLPLMRPLLALAGARETARHGEPGKDGDGWRRGGLVPALALMGMDLDGTDLVVLSACGTDLGVARSGEGVIGMAHAIQAAGARHVVASLWRIPDEGAVAFMRAFYAAYAAGARPPYAVREAQNVLRRRSLASVADAFVCWG